MTVPSVRTQAVLGSALMAFVLLLVFWPHGGGSSAVQVAAATPDYTVQVRLPHPDTGSDQADITVGRRDHGPVQLEQVTVDALMPSMGHAMPALTAAATGPGQYRTQGQLFLMAGSWQLSVHLYGAAGSQVVTVPVTVPAS